MMTRVMAKEDALWKLVLNKKQMKSHTTLHLMVQHAKHGRAAHQQ